MRTVQANGAHLELSGLSDFKGVPTLSSAILDAPTSPIDSPVPRPRDVLTAQVSGSRAVVSAVGDDDEHVPTARSAEPSTSIDYDHGGGVRGRPTRANRRLHISSAVSTRSLRNCMTWNGRRNRMQRRAKQSSPSTQPTRAARNTSLTWRRWKGVQAKPTLANRR